LTLNIYHIVRDLDIVSGGPSRSVPALAESQARFEGVKVHVLFQGRGNPIVQLAISDVEYFTFNGKLDCARVFAETAKDSVFHLHGLWNPNIHRAARFAQKQRTPYAVSTRGMLANWALGHKAIKKKVAWNLYQEKDLKQAACLLASSGFEKRDIEELLPACDVLIIPNGCHARPAAIDAQYFLPVKPDTRWALAMGRLHPVKGYAELIEAWAKANPVGWKLAIAGPDEAGYRATLESQIERHGLKDRVFLLGEIDDTRKWSLLDQCELFLAPSKTENFGMAIAEALQSGTPVVTTKGTPWQELVEYDCGWWVDNHQLAIEQALHQATGTASDVLRAKGLNGKALIQDKYTWQQVAKRTIELYRSII
jgi:glycosyltransferase involved in cell wall biosynthesis